MERLVGLYKVVREKHEVDSRHKARHTKKGNDQLFCKDGDQVSNAKPTKYYVHAWSFLLEYIY